MIKDFFAYLKILSSKGYSYISFILGVLSIVVAYSGKDIPLPPVIRDYIWIWSFLFLFIAGFSAWREHKNRADFEVSYEIQEINSDLDENIIKAKNEINLLSQEIEGNENGGLYSSLNRYVKIVAEIPRDKKIELEKYIAELGSLKEQCKQWKRIIFLIRNIGSSYDTYINIKVEMQKGVILEDENLKYDLNNAPDYPKNTNDVVLPPFLGFSHDTPRYRNKISDFEYELAYLHVNDKPTEIFYLGEGIIVEMGDMEFDFEIRSKNTNQIIKKNIKLKV